jgi:MFS family permease
VRLRNSLLPFYAVALLSEVVWMAIVPVAPAYSRLLDLSKVETGAVLGAAGFTTLVVSVPVGILADRIGTRGVTLASAVLVAASTLGQAVAVDFWSLLVARACFGIALGAIWTAGLAWIAEAGSNRDRPSALGVPVTVAGLGIMVGPVFAGGLASWLGVRTPFYVLAVLATLAAVAFAFSTGHDTPFRHEPWLTTFSVVRRERLVLASCVVMLLVGLMNGGINLLAPLELERNGLSSGVTGLVYSGSSALFVAVSIVLTRLGGRAVSVRLIGLAAILYGVSLVLVTTGSSSAQVIAFLLVRAPFWGTVSTLVYPLGARAAARAKQGTASVMGLLNFVWGLAGTLGPILAGVVAESADERVAYFVLLALAVTIGAWLLGVSDAPAGLEGAPEVVARADVRTGVVERREVPDGGAPD